MANSYTLKLPGDEAPRLKAFFLQHGFELRDAPHAFWQARGNGCNATFYQSGKLLIQGKEAEIYRGLLGDDTPDARPYFRALQKQPKPAPATWIGTDEAGKGDYFGPLVVAGVAVKKEDLEILFELGIDDSKALADHRLPAMVQGIEALCRTEVLFIGPAKYNALYARIGNLNKLLAWAHGKVIENLLTQGPADWILVDQFAKGPTLRRALGPLGLAANLTERTKAEEDPACGAASVLARAAYLRGLAALSKRFGVRLHPGAGPPTLAAGHAFIKTHGAAALNDVAKVHFATTKQIGG